MKKRGWLSFVAIIGVYMIVIFFFTSVYSLMDYIKMGKSDVATRFIGNLFDWLPWMFFTPLILQLIRKFSLDKIRLKRNLPVHLLVFVVFSFLKTMLIVWFKYYGKSYGPPEWGAYIVNFFSSLPWNLLIYALIVGIFYIIDYSRRVRERELRATRLEAQLSQAQLDVLKMQLNPHFLFNSLHAISALVHDQPDDADLMIGRLSDLLRLSLENRDRHRVPLKEELDFLKLYLEIESVRFQDRLTVIMDIDPDTLDMLVPNLILQPLAENAVRHGISPRKEGGQLTIHSGLRDNRLFLEVSDDGQGMSEAAMKKQKSGIGLTNTRARLNQMYGESHLFSVRNGSERGVHVFIELPIER
ncbi:histidine kinase [bacterium]|nr:histidine kinase [bacterium]